MGTILVFFLIASILPLYKTGVSLGFWQPITRPSTVSRAAQHVTTLKQATWFDCHVDETRNVDVCRAWDNKGRLIADGDFRLEDEDRAATASELHPSYIIAN